MLATVLFPFTNLVCPKIFRLIDLMLYFRYVISETTGCSDSPHQFWRLLELVGYTLNFRGTLEAQAYIKQLVGGFCYIHPNPKNPQSSLWGDAPAGARPQPTTTRLPFLRCAVSKAADIVLYPGQVDRINSEKKMEKASVLIVVRFYVFWCFLHLDS